MKLRACIIDDEKYSLATLKSDIDRYFPEIEIVATFQKPLVGVTFLESETIDILFLDIDMPQLSGLELAAKFPNPSFEIIFTTAYDQFAAKAFRLDATDYLLKPVSLDDLTAAIDKLKQRIAIKLKEIVPQKIFLKDNSGIEMIDLAEIIYCEADKNYCTFHFLSGKSKVMSKNIGQYEKLLDANIFYRIHQSYLINVNHIDKVNKTNHPSVVMKNSKELAISRANKSDFYQFLAQENKI